MCSVCALCVCVCVCVCVKREREVEEQTDRQKDLGCFDELNTRGLLSGRQQVPEGGHNTTQHNTTQENTRQHNTTQHTHTHSQHAGGSRPAGGRRQEGRRRGRRGRGRVHAMPEAARDQSGSHAKASCLLSSTGSTAGTSTRSVLLLHARALAHARTHTHTHTHARHTRPTHTPDNT